MIKQKNTSKRSDKKVKISKKDLNDYYWAYFMIAPTIIGLIILNIWPLIQTIYLSFNKTSDFGINQWIGLDNYKQMFSDPAVWQATLNTLKYTVISVPIGVILSLGIAVLLNSKIKGKT
ncbi:carbohydrate ABC transporter permease, partial [Clostridium frigoriphilum]